MTLVYEKQGHDAGPHTHVLIIGVGRYQHLIGGAGPINITQPPLGQLQSPPLSARALADWFTGGGHNNPAAPLGTVELLLSDASGQQYTPPGSSTTYNVEDATMRNIVFAFNRWDARCDRYGGNVAFFHFCGHGLEKGVKLLLPEDFAWNPNNPWAGGIDFDQTYNGMKQCHARTQYYVVDACRDYTDSMVPKDIKGTSLKAIDLTQLKNRTAPTLFATASGLPAFGDTGGVSRLTSALLECLNGRGAEKITGSGWVVTTGSLGASVQKLIELANEDLNTSERQIVDPTINENAYGSQRLHELDPQTPPPSVSVKFSCVPDAALPAATFYHKPMLGVRTAAPVPGPWVPTLPAGIYYFGVSFNTSQFNPLDIGPEFIEPPVCPVPLKVS